jgi:hypothetical protein
MLVVKEWVMSMFDQFDEWLIIVSIQEALTWLIIISLNFCLVCYVCVYMRVIKYCSSHGWLNESESGNDTTNERR